MKGNNILLKIITTISIILVILCSIFIYLIILGASKFKTKDEIKYEDEEQMKYLAQKHKRKG